MNNIFSSTNRKDRLFNIRKLNNLKNIQAVPHSDKIYHKRFQTFSQEIITKSPVYQQQIRILGQIKDQFQQTKQKLYDLIALKNQQLNQYRQKLQQLQDYKLVHQQRVRQLSVRQKQLRERKLQREAIFPYFNVLNYDQLRNILMTMRGLSQSQQINIDMMTYQEIMLLEEQIGNVNRGLTEQEIKNFSIDKADSQIAVDLCPICMEQFNKGQQVILFKCKHFFHAECISEWLRRERLCPICKQQVIQKVRE